MVFVNREKLPVQRFAFLCSQEVMAFHDDRFGPVQAVWVVLHDMKTIAKQPPP